MFAINYFSPDFYCNYEFSTYTLLFFITLLFIEKSFWEKRRKAGLTRRDGMQSKTTSSIPSERHKLNNILSSFFADEYASIYAGEHNVIIFLRRK